ncbi:MAG: DUF2460 domain-containing protein [Pseudomonadota bacterium]
MDGFHDVRFPLAVAFGSAGGPERRTEIVALGSGREQRNQRWSMSKRRYDAGTGVRDVDDLQTVVDFFEERRGRLYGFRFQDPLDHKSCDPSETPAGSDQLLGVGDGVETDFTLIKTYGEDFAPYQRTISLPEDGSLLVEVAGLVRTEGADFVFSDGIISFFPHAVPIQGAAVSAGYVFDTPVRFDTDQLSISLTAFDAGDIPSIPMVEIIL